MKALPKGTKVKVIKKGDSAAYHGFRVGETVVAQGELFEGNKIWQHFKDSTGWSQYLQDQHFELVVAEAPVVKATDELLDKDVSKELDINLPSKVVYAIVDADDEIIGCRVDRDKARDTKALLGGKRKGIRIIQYAAVKEIR
uniref:Uncharacterized protein n=2 Tax=unclassified bacterial viruses TaxID=12333 RepID=A0AAU6VXU2_9VIRU